MFRMDTADARGARFVVLKASVVFVRLDANAGSGVDAGASLMTIMSTMVMFRLIRSI